MSIDYTEPITETESLVRPERSWEDGQEYSLRPTRLPSSVRSLWITSCSMALPAWARPRSRGSLPTR